MSASVAEVIAVRVPERSWRSEVRAMRVVWWRDMVRFVDDPMRIAMWLIQPLLYLFVLGAGLQTLSAASTEGVDLNTFMFPGILCMAMWFSAMFSAASLVMDREVGFLREMMVAPVRRSSIVVGKCLGGTTVAAIQGVIVLALAGLVDVPYDPVLLLAMFGLQLLIAFAVTAFGMMVATSFKQAQTFNSVMQVLVFPIIFLSGALYPVSGLPTWLSVLNRLNPLTYAVDPLRRLVFDRLDISDAARRTLAPGVTWWGWRVPSLVEGGSCWLAAWRCWRSPSSSSRGRSDRLTWPSAHFDVFRVTAARTSLSARARRSPRPRGSRWHAVLPSRPELKRPEGALDPVLRIRSAISSRRSSSTRSSAALRVAGLGGRGVGWLSTAAAVRLLSPTAMTSCRHPVASSSAFAVLLGSLAGSCPICCARRRS